jgi:hypothetical protein
MCFDSLVVFLGGVGRFSVLGSRSQRGQFENSEKQATQNKQLSKMFCQRQKHRVIEKNKAPQKKQFPVLGPRICFLAFLLVFGGFYASCKWQGQLYNKL